MWLIYIFLFLVIVVVAGAFFASFKHNQEVKNGIAKAKDWSLMEGLKIFSVFASIIYGIILILSFVYFLIFVEKPVSDYKGYGSDEHKNSTSINCFRQSKQQLALAIGRGGSKDWAECMKREGYSAK
jgi:TRAP-type C4-dicarboxylate transport system permease small subunit